MHSPQAAQASDQKNTGFQNSNSDSDSAEYASQSEELRRDYIEDLFAFLPAQSILSTEQQLRPYESDGLTAIKQTPLLVVLPETLEQVQSVMRWANQREVPVVARGAGTGLSGGASPHPRGILMGLAKFNRILELNPLGGYAVVQPGVRNLAISEAARPHNLYYAPDPSSQIACTIGGNVAENSGGVHCLKYGLTVHNILELTVVTATGDLLTVGGDSPEQYGYDLLGILTGSEGMLAITVEIIMASFDSVESAGAAVGAVIAEGIIPAGMELMDNPAIRASEAFAECGLPSGCSCAYSV